MPPNPWQTNQFLSTGKQVLLNCSRQFGKSTLVSALALHTAQFIPGSLTLILCPAQWQSSELFRKVMNTYNDMKRPIPTVGETQLKMELKNGSRIG